MEDRLFGRSESNAVECKFSERNITSVENGEDYETDRSTRSTLGWIECRESLEDWTRYLNLFKNTKTQSYYKVRISVLDSQCGN